jgi:hypothetical protein
MKICVPAPAESTSLNPEMIALLKQHFWADFSDVIPALSWDKKTPAN